jgi:hypothetical protein
MARGVWSAVSVSGILPPMTSSPLYRTHLLLLLLLTGLGGGTLAFEGRVQLPVAAHLHTRFSDGAHRLSEVVAMARAAGYQAVWVTDHADFYWEYPVLGTTVGYWRPSLREHGYEAYLRACRDVQAANPDMTLIPGFEAAPSYYWTGRLTDKQLINEQWMKHLIVLGIEEPRAFRRLPMLAYGTASHRPGFVDPGEAPYQEFVQAVRAAGGEAFWAHPSIERQRTILRHIESRVSAYAPSLLTVPDSAGLAVRGVDDPIVAPGGLWDQALAAYCAGTRPRPAWVTVELDYHQGRFPNRRVLVALVPAEVQHQPQARKQACVTAIKDGHCYVASGPPGSIVVADFHASSGAAAARGPGCALTASTPVTLAYSITTRNPLQWVRIVRDGTVVFESASPVASWTDPQPVSPGNVCAYRMMARGDGETFAVTNPLFVRGGAASSPPSPKGSLP